MPVRGDGLRQRKVEGTTSGERYFLCSGKESYTTSLYFPDAEQRGRSRGQHWKISFVGKTRFITAESEANTRMPYGEPFVLS